MSDFYNLPKHISLSDAEVKEYFKEIKNGNINIREFFIKNNLRLVLNVAKTYQNTGLEFEDLVSIGTIGLINAVDKYNSDLNIKFSTFASRCISNQILMVLRKKQINTISIESEFRNKKTDESFNLEEVLPDENIDVEKEYYEYETSLVIMEILDTLGEKERKVIEMHFGFYSEKQYTQKEIASIMNISQSYVSRIISRTIKKLKTNSKTKKLVLNMYN